MNESYHCVSCYLLDEYIIYSGPDTLSKLYEEIEKETFTYLKVRCANSYERMIVHQWANSLKLIHGRYDSWDKGTQLRCCPPCSQCYKIAGETNYRLRGVWIAKDPKYKKFLTRKDRAHQK